MYTLLIHGEVRMGHIWISDIGKGGFQILITPYLQTPITTRVGFWGKGPRSYQIAFPGGSLLTSYPPP